MMHKVYRRFIECFVLSYVVAVLLGAPIMSVKETGGFAMLMSILLVVPRMALHLSLDKSLLESIIGQRSLDPSTDWKEECVRTLTWFTIAGSWASAIVIPLDWDKPWSCSLIKLNLNRLFYVTFPASSSNKEDLN
ncbi:phosphatidylinositol-glycan biosynthesis class F protein-like isoform X3 [Artemia franciscana]|uniref:phosphatidylinositol-glycan biosynthesis class F protein-like isoform X3 n=1 Tax=Artemia franciscana TaxID=6661 RepID=UPI0032DBACAF